LTINQLFNSICSILNGDINRVIHIPSRPGDIKYSYANPEKIEKYFGWNSQWSFDRALTETIEWYSKNQ